MLTLMNKKFKTPLHLACKNKNPNLVYFLLKRGAELNLKNLNRVNIKKKKIEFSLIQIKKFQEYCSRYLLYI